MRIAIENQIEFGYSTPATYAIQHLRVWPHTSNVQRVQRWSVSVGRQDRFPEFNDCFGNTVLEATQSDPHEAVRINIAGLVDTYPSDGIFSARDEPLPLLYYLSETDLTGSDDNVLDLATAVRTASLKERIDGLHRLMAEVGKTLTYALDEDDDDTVTAGQALARTSGAAREHAHVFIACARSLEIPARYVTGYRLQEDDDEGPVEPAYAWAEAWVDTLGWVGFDPVHQVCPADSYVRVACGVDYLAAAPIRRSQRGGGEETTTSTVVVNQVQAQQ